MFVFLQSQYKKYKVLNAEQFVHIQNLVNRLDVHGFDFNISFGVEFANDNYLGVFAPQVAYHGKNGTSGVILRLHHHAVTKARRLVWMGKA